jgi:biotin carboxylase
VHTTWLCRDKPSMKEALRQAGVPTAASAAVSSAAQAQAFAAQATR